MWKCDFRGDLSVLFHTCVTIGNVVLIICENLEIGFETGNEVKGKSTLSCNQFILFRAVQNTEKLLRAKSSIE